MCWCGQFFFDLGMQSNGGGEGQAKQRWLKYLDASLVDTRRSPSIMVKAKEGYLAVLGWLYRPICVQQHLHASAVVYWCSQSGTRPIINVIKKFYMLVIIQITERCQFTPKRFHFIPALLWIDQPYTILKWIIHGNCLICESFQGFSIIIRHKHMFEFWYTITYKQKWNITSVIVSVCMCVSTCMRERIISWLVYY